MKKRGDEVSFVIRSLTIQSVSSLGFIELVRRDQDGLQLSCRSNSFRVHEQIRIQKERRSKNVGGGDSSARTRSSACSRSSLLDSLNKNP